MRPRKRIAAACAVLLAVLASRGAGAGVRLAMELYKTGKYAEAVAEFQALVDSAPDYDFGRFMLGMSLLKLGRPWDAEAHLLRAIKLNGADFRYHGGLADAYLARRDLVRAVATLRVAEPFAADDRERYQLYARRGFAYLELGKPAEAAADLERAAALRPHASVRLGLGRAYHGLGEPSRAAPVLREALEEQPDDAATLRLLSAVLLDLAARTEGPEARRAIYAEALGVAGRLVGVEPNAVDGHNLAGRAALGAHDYARAEQELRHVLAREPEHCWALTNLGKTYIALGRFAEAESLLEIAVTCPPRLVAAYESLGFALREQGKLEAAVATYEAALALAPSPSIREAIAFCRGRLATAGAGSRQGE